MTNEKNRTDAHYMYGKAIELIELGAKTPQIADILDIGESTVNFLKQFNLWAKMNQLDKLATKLQTHKPKVEAVCKHWKIDIADIEAIANKANKKEEPAKNEEIVKAQDKATPDNNALYLLGIKQNLDEQTHLLTDLCDIVPPKYVRDITSALENDVTALGNHITQQAEKVISAADTNTDLICQKLDKVCELLEKISYNTKKLNGGANQ